MEQSLEEIFRSNLRLFRQNAKLSQEKLSALLDKNINYINMIEGGKSTPPLSVIEQIAKILNVNPSEFLVEHTSSGYFDKIALINTASEQISQKAKEVLLELMKDL